jgi:hypothetical protein
VKIGRVVLAAQGWRRIYGGKQELAGWSAGWVSGLKLLSLATNRLGTVNGRSEYRLEEGAGFGRDDALLHVS